MLRLAEKVGTASSGRRKVNHKSNRLYYYQLNCPSFRYLPDFLDDRRATLADIIEKSLKRGKGAEVQAAARLSLLLAVQLPDAEDVSTNIFPSRKYVQEKPIAD